MHDYRRYAVVLRTSEEEFLVAPLPIREKDAPFPMLEELRDFSLWTPDLLRRYVINYTGYYVFCPKCMHQVTVSPPTHVIPPGERTKKERESLAGYVADLAPCPDCGAVSHDIPVLINSEYRGAVFLHPLRSKPTDWDKAPRIVDFGSIRLHSYKAEIYRWKAEVAPYSHKGAMGALKKFTGKKWQKTITDENGTFPTGLLENLKYPSSPAYPAGENKDAARDSAGGKIEIPMELLDVTDDLPIPDHLKD